MKQDNGHHAATPARENIGWLRKLEAATDKHDRLKALNAELVEALERTVCALEEAAEDGGTIYDETMDMARAVLAKARE